MGFFSHFSKISREKKLKLFFDTIKAAPNEKILDVGGEISLHPSREVKFVDTYPFKENLSVVNISEEHINTITSVYPSINALVGDACNLPWPDDYFDIVHSNAVIEHVGTYERQKKMASEIMRVSKKWFVTTPNRLYPFEFHMRLPFITWLPRQCYLWTGSILSYNHVKKKYARGVKREDLRLMTSKEFKACFPGSEIIKQRITFMPETLIAIGQKQT